MKIRWEENGSEEAGSFIRIYIYRYSHTRSINIDINLLYKFDVHM